MAGARLCAHRTDSATEPVNGRRSTHAHRVAREAFRVRDADGTLERLTPKHVPQRIHFDLKAQKWAPQRDDSSASRTCLTNAATLPCHRANPKWPIGRRTRLHYTHLCTPSVEAGEGLVAHIQARSSDLVPRQPPALLHHIRASMQRS